MKPQYGDQYVWRTSASDPWNTANYTVVDVKGKWTRLRHSSGFEVSVPWFELWLLYKKIYTHREAKCRFCGKPATWYGLCDECNERAKSPQ